MKELTDIMSCGRIKISELSKSRWKGQGRKPEKEE
jgi:hypothetical protein